MSGPGPGEWQTEAEHAAGICDSVSSNIYAVVLNPSKSYVLEWLREARGELTRAAEMLDKAIELAEGGT